MTENLHSLAYFSRSVPSGLGAASHVELGRILATARKNNLRKDVTGALIFSDDYFAQVLEGPREAIDAIFESIECDPRHSHVTVIHFKPVEARRFSKWSMAFAKVPGSSAAELRVNDVLNNPGTLTAYDSGRDIQSLLQDLIDAHGGVHAATDVDIDVVERPAVPAAPS